MIKRLMLTTLVLALLLAACAPSQASKRANGLTVAVPMGRLATALRGAAAVYAQSGGGLVTVAALGADGYDDMLSAELLSGSDRYDLVFLPADGLAKWASYKALQPIPTEQVETAGIAPWLARMTVSSAAAQLGDTPADPGLLYGLPTEPGFDVLWLRADWLAQAGIDLPPDSCGRAALPPITWGWVRASAEAMHKPPERYGAAIAGSDQSAGQDFSDVLAGLGGQIIDVDYQVTIDDPAGQQALAVYTALAVLSAPAAGSFTRAEVIRDLQDGRAGLGIAPLSAAQTLLDCDESPKLCPDGGKSRAAASSTTAKTPENVMRWVWLPGLAQANAAVGDLSAWAIPLHAARADDAGRFAAWLVSAAGARAWAANGGVPAQQAVLGSMPIRDRPTIETPTLDRSSSKGQAAVPVSPVIKPVVPTGCALDWVADYRAAFPPLTASDTIWGAVNTAAHAAVVGEPAPATVTLPADQSTLAGETRPAAVLKTAAVAIRAALRQAGYAFR